MTPPALVSRRRSIVDPSKHGAAVFAKDGGWRALEQCPGLFVLFEAVDSRHSGWAGLASQLPRLVGDTVGAEMDRDVRDAVDTTVRSGKGNFVSAGAARMYVSPVRRNRRVFGVLVVAVRPQALSRVDGAAGDQDARLESAARALGRAIEDKLGAQEAPDDGARARRLLAVLRFLTELRDAEEDQLLRTVLQAVAVWYDVEAFAYRRDATGTFVIDAWLPGADVTARPRVLPPNIVSMVRDAPTLLSSLGELEDVGWHDPTGEILLTPITYCRRHQWIIAVGGTLDDEAVTTFAAIRLAVGTMLERRVEREARRLGDQLRDLLHTAEPAGDDITSLLLDVLVKHVPAAGGRVLVESKEGSLTLASSLPTGEVTADSVLRSDCVRVALALEGERTLRVDLEGPPGVPFRPVNIAIVEAAVASIEGWLAAEAHWSRGARHDAIPRIGFEARIDEEVARARRFGLDLMLLLIGATPATLTSHAEKMMTDAIRGVLRGSDLIGKLGSGEIAVLLVHTGAEGARSVEGRLKERLQALMRHGQVPLLSMGESGFPSGGGSAAALVAQARVQQAIVMNAGGATDGA